MKRRLFLWVGLGVAATALAYWICVQQPTDSLRSQSSSPSEAESSEGLTSPTRSASKQAEAEAAMSVSIKRERRAEAYEAATVASQSHVAWLIQIDVSKPITYEEAERWKRTLSDLIAQGPAAIPAI